MATKKIMYVNRVTPHGGITAKESLDVVLISAAFDQDVALAFIDDGVYQLLKGQEPEKTGSRHVAKSFAALGDYDVRKIYVEQESLTERGLSEADLVDLRHENPEDDYRDTASIRFISREKLARLFSRQDVLFTF